MENGQHFPNATRNLPRTISLRVSALLHLFRQTLAPATTFPANKYRIRPETLSNQLNIYIAIYVLLYIVCAYVQRKSKSRVFTEERKKRSAYSLSMLPMIQDL